MTDLPASGTDGAGAGGVPRLPPPPPPAPGPVPGWIPGSAPAAPAGPVQGWIPGSAPAAPPGPRGTSGRTSVAVVAIILAVVFGANLVNAAIPYPQDPGSVDAGPGLPAGSAAPGPGEDPGPVPAGAELAVGGGYTLSPPAGWTLVGNDDGLTVLQKSGVLLIAGGTAWEGTASELAERYRDSWFANGRFTGDEAQEGTIGDGIPAAAITYTGVANGTQVDGVIVAASLGGTGLLLNVYGASGSLDGVEDDIDAILASVRSWAQ